MKKKISFLIVLLVASVAGAQTELVAGEGHVILFSKTDACAEGQGVVADAPWLQIAALDARGWLGVAVEPAEPLAGVIVTNLIQNSPAERSGLRRGDLIVSVAGQSIFDAPDLAGVIAGTEPGQGVQLAVERGGHPIRVDATLVAPPPVVAWSHETARIKVRDGITAANLLRVSADGDVTVESLDSLDGVNLPDAVRETLADRFGTVDTEIVFDDDDTLDLRMSLPDEGLIVELDEPGVGPVMLMQDGKAHLFEDLAELEGLFPDAAERFGDRLLLTGDVAEWVREQGHGELLYQVQLDPAVAPTVSRSETFRVDPHGGIEVVVQRGTTQVVREYLDEDDLADREPELYRRYREALDE